MLLGVQNASAAVRQRKKTASKQTSAPSKSSRTRKTSKKTAKRQPKPSVARGRGLVVTDITELRNIRLDSGIVYHQYRTNGAKPIIAHVIECDRTVAGNAVRVVKGEDHAIGLERIKEMSQRFDSRSNHVLYGMINGNFWKAVSNLMIGPCVIDGEVIQMSRYKRWSSAMFDIRNNMYIDTFELSGMVSIGQKRFPIESVNDRRNHT
jgi:hypothetical protein